jgi:hypothetical protein
MHNETYINAVLPVFAQTVITNFTEVKHDSNWTTALSHGHMLTYYAVQNNSLFLMFGKLKRKILGKDKITGIVL